MSTEEAVWEGGGGRRLVGGRGALFPLLAILELSRELGRVSNLNLSINWYHHIKGHVKIGYLTKFGALSKVEQGSSYDSWNMVKDPYKRL